MAPDASWWWLLVVAVAVLVGAGGLVWWQSRFVLRTMADAQARHEQHLREVLDRFLSRHFEEFTMARMIGRQAEADQAEEADAEQEAVDDWVRRKEELLAEVGERRP